MELKEARYILAIAQHKSISKAAEKLFISQPSLSKYLKNIEVQLGEPLFTRINNQYIATYIGERYLDYAAKIIEQADEWDHEYNDLRHHGRGRMNIAIPIMRGSCLIQPTLPKFYSIYPNVNINVVEHVHFVAEHTLTDYSIDLAIYNAPVFPSELEYEVIGSEEVVLVVSKMHPLARAGVSREGFRYPWVDLSRFAGDKFILLYPDQTTGDVSQRLFKEYDMAPDVLLYTRNSQMSINLAVEGIGIAFAPESYFTTLPGRDKAVCLSVGRTATKTTLIAAYHKTRYLPQYTKAYLNIIATYFNDIIGNRGEV